MFQFAERELGPFARVATAYSPSESLSDAAYQHPLLTPSCFNQRIGITEIPRATSALRANVLPRALLCHLPHTHRAYNSACLRCWWPRRWPCVLALNSDLLFLRLCSEGVDSRSFALSVGLDSVTPGDTMVYYTGTTHLGSREILCRRGGRWWLG